jgi:acyl carrier protein
MNVSTRDLAYQKIVERTCVLFGKTPEELSEETRFIEDLGAKSGNVSQMTTFLEDEFDVEISFMEFSRRPTLGMAADYIVELCEE